MLKRKRNQALSSAHVQTSLKLLSQNRNCKYTGQIGLLQIVYMAFDASILRCVSVIRKAQFSPRVWKFLKFKGKTEENVRKTRKNLRNRGSKFLISYFL